ncbi:MAG: hypothetical protein ABJZ55_17650 [Fuerstiella sp.]
MIEDPYPEMQFPQASKFARGFAVVVGGLTAIILFAICVIRKWKNPLPVSLVGWVVEITVDSVILASCYAMTSLCVWAVVFTPRAEYLFVQRLTRLAVWAIAMIVLVVVLLFGGRALVG